MIIERPLLRKQREFIELNPAGGAKLLVAGMGSGKTHTLITQAAIYTERYKGLPVIAMSTTHSILWNTLLYPFLKLLDQSGIRYTTHGDKKLIRIYYDKNRPSELLYGSYEAGDVVALNVAAGIFDEFDLCNDAPNFFKDNVIARVRKGDENNCNIALATTPEQGGFSYQFFSEQGEYYDIRNPFEKVIMTSISNPYQDMNMLAMRMRLLSPEKRRAYIYGEWANLTERTCFYNFNDSLIVDIPLDEAYYNAEEIVIGIDFNVSKLVASVSIDSMGQVKTIDEIVDYNSNTEKLMLKLRDYAAKHFGRSKIVFYPDYSSDAKKTNSPYTDMDIIKRYFADATIYKKPNPLIKDRYAVTNFMFAEGKLIVDRRCGQIIRDLRNINNTPFGTFDKIALEKKGLTHAIDAFSYPIYHRYANYFKAMFRQYGTRQQFIA